MVKTTSLVSLRSYAELKRRIKEALILGQRRVVEAKVNTYWKIGKLIRQHVLLNKDRAEYGKKVVRRLAGDLEVGERLLYRCIQFAQKVPNLSTWTNLGNGRTLTWSQIRTLMTIPDEKDRLALTRRAERFDWDTRKLEEVVKTEKEDREKAEEAKYVKMEFPRPTKNKGNLLTPHKGALHNYRVISVKGASGVEELKLDLGFRFRKRLSLFKAPATLKAGDIVESLPSGRAYRLKKAAAKTERDLFTYEARVLRVVDADTLYVEIDLGFGDSVEDYLRLRGIDAPEIETKAGKIARAFVVSELKDVPTITLRSSTSDRWDRYLADVFYMPARGEERFLNNRLLEAGLARRLRL